MGCSGFISEKPWKTQTCFSRSGWNFSWDLPGLVNVYKKLMGKSPFWMGKSPCYSWENPRFRLGHFPVRYLWWKLWWKSTQNLAHFNPLNGLVEKVKMFCVSGKHALSSFFYGVLGWFLDGQLDWCTKVGPEFNFDQSKGPVSVKWFQGGKTNLSYNCLDRNIEQGNGSSVSTATLIFLQLLSYCCLVGNGWEWVNGMIITSDSGSFLKIPC